MKSVFSAVRRNSLYILLVAFIISLNLIVAAHENKAKRSHTAATVQADKEKKPQTERSVFDKEELRVREERLKAMASEKPLLYLVIALANITILFFIFIGIIMDVYFLKRWVARKPVSIRTNTQEKARWNIPDVIKVTIIFFAFGYAFVMVQDVVSEKIVLFRNENFRMVFDTAVMNFVGIGVVLCFVVKKYGHSLKDFGLTVAGFWRNVYYAFIGYLSLVPVVVVIMVVTFFVVKMFNYEPPVQQIVKIFMEEKGTGVLLFSTLFAAIFGPITEEMFFRGFMYPALRNSIGVFWGMLITSIVFSSLHAHWVGLLPIIALGFLLVYLYEKTGSLVPCITVHIMHNVGMVGIVFFAKWLG